MSFLPVTLEQAALARAAREPYRSLCADTDAVIIPWRAYKNFLEVTAQYWNSDDPAAPYIQAVRVMVGALQWTGCRIKEVEKMRPSLIFGNAAYWPIGKNQKGMRREYFPDEFLRELDLYRSQNRVPEDALFGICEETFTRYFNRYVRPRLSAEWQEKMIVVKNNLLGLDYKLKLKGFRKNFQTILFKKLWDKYGDPTIAAEFVAKRMRYENKDISIQHYIQNFEALDIDEWLAYWDSAHVATTEQRRLVDFAL